MKTLGKPFYGWWILLSASIVLMTAFSMASYALPIFYPELVNTFHWPRASVAFGGSFKTFLVGFVAPVNGWIIDRWGVKSILLAGTAGVGISYALLSGVDSLWQFFLVCFLLGVGASWIHYLPNQLLVANWFVKKRGLSIGILQTLSGFGDTLVPLLCAALIRSMGWRQTLLVLPAILIAPLLAVMFLVKNKPQDAGLYPDGAPGPPPEVSLGAGARDSMSPGWDFGSFKTTTFWMLAGMLLFIGWSTFSVWQHFVLFLRDMGFNPTVAASLFSLFLGCSTISRLISGPLSDRISPGYVMVLSLILLGLALVFLVSSENHAMIYASMVVFGLGYGGSITCRPLIVFEHFGGAGVGKIYGAATAVFTTGALVGPWLSGYIFDKTDSYRLAFLLALILICISIAMVALLRRAAARSADSARAAHHSLAPR